MDDINETIFKAVKDNLENGSDVNELLLKICSGKADEEEKQKWKEVTGLNEEDTDKLVESFEKGYNAALEMDTSELEFLKKEVEELKKKVDFLMTKIDMTNYSQFI